MRPELVLGHGRELADPVGVEDLVDLPRQVDLLHVGRHLGGEPAVARGPGRARPDDRGEILHHGVEITHALAGVVVVEEAVDHVEPALHHPPQVGDDLLDLLALGPHGPDLVEGPCRPPRRGSQKQRVVRAPVSIGSRRDCTALPVRPDGRQRPHSGRRPLGRPEATDPQRNGPGGRAARSGRRPGPRQPRGPPARRSGCRCSTPGLSPDPIRRPRPTTTRFTSRRRGWRQDHEGPRCRPPGEPTGGPPGAGHRREGRLHARSLDGHPPGRGRRQRRRCRRPPVPRPPSAAPRPVHRTDAHG